MNDIDMLRAIIDGDVDSLRDMVEFESCDDMLAAREAAMRDMRDDVVMNDDDDIDPFIPSHIPDAVQSYTEYIAPPPEDTDTVTSSNDVVEIPVTESRFGFDRYAHIPAGTRVDDAIFTSGFIDRNGRMYIVPAYGHYDFATAYLTERCMVPDHGDNVTRLESMGWIHVSFIEYIHRGQRIVSLGMFTNLEPTDEQRFALFDMYRDCPETLREDFVKSVRDGVYTEFMREV